MKQVQKQKAAKRKDEKETVREEYHDPIIRAAKKAKEKRGPKNV